MVKSVVKYEEEKEIEYPCLMQYKEWGMVVLFESAGIGQVVHKGNSGWTIGGMIDGWNMDKFKPFKGSVTLSNGDE